MHAIRTLVDHFTPHTFLPPAPAQAPAFPGASQLLSDIPLLAQSSLYAQAFEV